MVLLETDCYQPKVRRLLKNIVAGGRVANLYIFYGPTKSGRTTATRDFFKLLNDIDHFEHHQDFYHLNPASRIKIEQVRDIQSYIKYGPRQARNLLVLVEKAENMTQEAANAFLKTLEEPPQSVIFVLEVQQLSELLPTIVSRAQQVRFEALKPQQVREQVQNLEPEDLSIVENWQDLELINWYLKNKSLFFQLQNIKMISDLDILDISEQLAKKGKPEIELLIKALTQIFFAKQDYQCNNILLRYSKKLSVPLNNKLLLEAMFYELKGS